MIARPARTLLHFVFEIKKVWALSLGHDYSEGSKRGLCDNIKLINCTVKSEKSNTEIKAEKPKGLDSNLKHAESIVFFKNH